MAFALSMSGLTGAAKAIDVIGNNIANSQTIGFKSSKVRFADAVAAATAGAASSAAGVSTSIINQEFTQGTLLQSDNPLDMAITGMGFFRLKNTDGSLSYSRDGQFQLAYDAEFPDRRFLVSRTGLAVTGYLAEYTEDPQGVIVASGAPKEISIDPVMPAKATTTASVGATLDARVGVPSVAPFAVNNAQTYTNTTALTVFDTTGASHELRLYFARSAPGNAWDLYTALDGGAQTGPAALSFDSVGVMTTPMPLAAQTYTLASGESMSVALDFSGTVQYGRSFSVDSLRQDGYRVGAIENASGFRVAPDGVIDAFYSNGQSRKVAQLVLANFINPDALISLGDNQWKENADPVNGTGRVILDIPGPGGLGMGLGPIQGGTKEQSNVDLSTELVALIEQQRNYQASAQTFKILDQILQNLANVR